MGIEELRACEYWTEREGRAAVELWRRSGMPLQTWARSVGLTASRVAYWRGLGSRRPAGTTTAAALAVTLAPVTVVGSVPRGVLTIELRSGRAIKVEGDVDDTVLARVITIAERAPC